MSFPCSRSTLAHSRRTGHVQRSLYNFTKKKKKDQLTTSSFKGWVSKPDCPCIRFTPASLSGLDRQLILPSIPRSLLSTQFSYLTPRFAWLLPRLLPHFPDLFPHRTTPYANKYPRNHYTPKHTICEILHTARPSRPPPYHFSTYVTPSTNPSWLAPLNQMLRYDIYI